MKTQFKFLPVALLTTITLGTVSCDNEDEPTPGNTEGPSVDNVFANGLPASVDGATFTVDDKGRLTQIVEGDTKVTFEYGSFAVSRAETFDVLMKERSTNYPDEGSDIYMRLNKQGFVEYAYQVYLDDEDEPDEWYFEYNKDGQLTKLQRSESGDKYVVTYTDGDITSMVADDEDGDHSEYSYTYVNDTYKTAIANKGCLMMFDSFFDIDMDEMGVAYFAGLLGKATKNLPMGYTEKAKEGGSTYTYVSKFNWEFNSNQLPVKFWENDEEWDVITFSWK